MTDHSGPGAVCYNELAEQLAGLLAGEPDRTANAANAAALIHGAIGRVNWTGFYFLQGQTLVLGPFQGNPACVRIPLGRGVCGTAAARGETLVVEDVHAFAGHIACDSASASEIVIPLKKDGAVFGVLDVDSPEHGRFSRADQAGLEQLARLFEAAW